MTALVNIPGGEVQHVPSDLSARLDWLRSFGQPRLMCMRDGTWYGVIDMHVSSKGAEFKVASDMSCLKPDDAITQVIERMLETLAKIGRGE